MKLILASDQSFLMKYGYDLTGIPKDKIYIGYVTTASNAASNDDYVKKHRQRMQESGYKFEEIDIENKSEKELLFFFDNKNVIHIEGGHTLYLLKAIKKSGFDKVLKKCLDKGMIYIGTSAGSSIMGPTIEFSSHFPEGTPKDELMALNYVPFLIKAHYIEGKEIVYREKIKKFNYPVRILRDGQGILVEDGKYTFVGDGEEANLDA